jgi:hypothetical protein
MKNDENKIDGKNNGEKKNRRETMRRTSRNGESLVECDMPHNSYFNLSHLF